MKGKAFDIKVFKTILKFTNPINGALMALLFLGISLFSPHVQYLLKQTVDGYIQTKDARLVIYTL
jgi:hypothetical protein